MAAVAREDTLIRPLLSRYIIETDRWYGPLFTNVRLTRTNAPIEFRPLPEDDPKIRRPDITKARQLLGWEPKVPLEEGLRRTIEYFRGVV